MVTMWSSQNHSERRLRPWETRLVAGTGSVGLLDDVGRYIDGAGNGQPGSDAVIDIARKGVSF
jgi:hypothetical protein